MNDDFLVNDDESEEECKARLQRIREDAKSGRKYYPPEPQPYTRHAKHDMEFETKVRQMSELMSMGWSSLEKHVGLDSYRRGMSKAAYYVMDECHHIDPAMYWTTEYKSEPKEKDWERKTFKSGGPTTPSEAVRLKRRAERKAKRKK